MISEHLQWKKQLAHVQVKLNREKGILCNVKDNTNLKIFLSFTFYVTFLMCCSVVRLSKTNQSETQAIENQEP